MNKRRQYLTNPWTIISFIVFLFWLGVTWWTLKYQINILQDKTAEIDAVKTQYYDIQTKLAEIQTNLSRIMANIK
jgi:hypothetical protein